MRVLIFLGHPAHYHLFKNIVKEFEKKKYECKVLIRTKDILEELCIQENIGFTNVLPEIRRNSYFSIALSYVRKYRRISAIIRTFKPDVLLGSEPSLTHLGKFFNIPSFVFSEDDASIIPQFVKIAYPFASVILSPQSCDAGKWSYKKIGYDGFHKLAYLHPAVFTPKIEKTEGLADSNYFILRFTNLAAYHDENRAGIDNSLAKRLIQILEPHGKIYISSERALPPGFQKYKLNVNPAKIHHVLSFARMYIGDSQSMAVESALLGTPGIRFNDFADEIGVLNELENNYQLTTSFKTTRIDDFLVAVKEMIVDNTLSETYKKRQQKMISEKINVLQFFMWFIENYPKSQEIMKKQPEYQYNFR